MGGHSGGSTITNGILGSPETGRGLMTGKKHEQMILQSESEIQRTLF
jgi:hypothetical protein